MHRSRPLLLLLCLGFSQASAAPPTRASDFYLRETPSGGVGTAFAYHSVPLACRKGTLVLPLRDGGMSPGFGKGRMTAPALSLLLEGRAVTHLRALNPNSGNLNPNELAGVTLAPNQIQFHCQEGHVRWAAGNSVKVINK